MSVSHKTHVPGPLASPPLSPIGIPRPPTPGGGPLSSHPATPVNGGGYFPPPPRSSSSISKPATPPKSSTDTEDSRKRVDSVLRTPLSPLSPNVEPSPTRLRRRDSFGVRKLLSLTSLRNSIAGNSRTDLSLHRTKSTGLENLSRLDTGIDHRRRPSSPSVYSSASVRSHNTNGSTVQQPQQSYQATILGGVSSQPVPQLRKRKSGSWFRRKSAIFFMEGDADAAAAEDEEQQEQQPARVHLKRSGSMLKISDPILISAPPPSLPQVNSLRGGRLTDGAFTGDDVFTSIGR